MTIVADTTAPGRSRACRRPHDETATARVTSTALVASIGLMTEVQMVRLDGGAALAGARQANDI